MLLSVHVPHMRWPPITHAASLMRLSTGKAPQARMTSCMILCLDSWRIVDTCADGGFHKLKLPMRTRWSKPPSLKCTMMIWAVVCGCLSSSQCPALTVCDDISHPSLVALLRMKVTYPRSIRSINSVAPNSSIIVSVNQFSIHARHVALGCKALLSMFDVSSGNPDKHITSHCCMRLLMSSLNCFSFFSHDVSLHAKCINANFGICCVWLECFRER